MLYELIATVRPIGITGKSNLNEVKEIAKTAGTQILASGGVIRGITNWGTYLLPKPFSKNGVRHHTGHHFIIRYDASATTQHSVRRTMSLDPRLLRFSTVKMGEKLDDTKDIGGIAAWGGKKSQSRV